MVGEDPRRWMWPEALATLARAERMRHDIFVLAPAARPAWEPPVDVLETDDEVLIFAALPGVAPEQVEAVIEGADLVIAGRRVLPPQLRTATIHRLELPQGFFQRRIPLPAGRYDGVSRTVIDGCLLIRLHKAK